MKTNKLIQDLIAKLKQIEIELGLEANGANIHERCQIRTIILGWISLLENCRCKDCKKCEKFNLVNQVLDETKIRVKKI